MSEEETIKSFKSLMYNAKANWDYFSYEILFNFFSLYNNAIEENKKLKNTDLKQAKIEYLEVLNEKLQKENKELKKEIKSWKKYSDEQEENIIEKNNIICNLEFQREKQQKEIEEKDKIINVMAEYISKKEILVDKHCYALTAEAVKQWFEKQIK
jgi:hypothetical protein